MDIWDLLRTNYVAWAANPLPSIIALGVGGYGGYWLGRHRHQAKIDGLEERIKLKDEQIAFKDDAIESVNTKPAPRHVGRANTRDAESSMLDSAPPPATGRFDGVNAKIIQDTEAKLKDVLLRTNYKFVFNPVSDLSKRISFLPNGMIGEGRNNNESRWRVDHGRLEILDSTGSVYSRFNLLDDGARLHHTNEPDTRSIRGQYMYPIEMRTE